MLLVIFLFRFFLWLYLKNQIQKRGSRNPLYVLYAIFPKSFLDQSRRRVCHLYFFCPVAVLPIIYSSDSFGSGERPTLETSTLQITVVYTNINNVIIT